MEEDFQNLDNTTLISRNPWYKTGSGAFFLAFIIFILVIAIVFGSFVVFYAWQVRYGDSEELAQQFLTQDQGERSIFQAEKIENFSKYIRPYSPVLGEGQRAITILAFLDFKCPFCQGSYDIFKGMTDKYASIVQVVFKHLPLTDTEEEGMLPALASVCAGEQGKFWEYYDLIFLQLKFSAEDLLSYAEVLNLDQTKFSQCVESNIASGYLEQDMLDAVELNLRGTPTYLINGYKVEGTLTAEEWDQIILEILQK